MRSTTLKIGDEITWAELVAPCVKAVLLQQWCSVRPCIFKFQIMACALKAKALEGNMLFQKVKEEFEKDKRDLQALSKNRCEAS